MRWCDTKREPSVLEFATAVPYISPSQGDPKRGDALATQPMDLEDETSFRHATDGSAMSTLDGEDQGRTEREASGVHRRTGRVLVVEPVPHERTAWDGVREIHHLEFVAGPKTLPRALRMPGTPRAVSVALQRQLRRDQRATLLSELDKVHGLGDVRVVIDVRRCDLSSAIALVEAGYILCADDLLHPGTTPRAAVNRTTMTEQLQDVEFRVRLQKTIGATYVSDRHDLSRAEYAVLRGLMDHLDGPTLAKYTGLALTTIKSHYRNMRTKSEKGSMADLVAMANHRAMAVGIDLNRLR